MAFESAAEERDGPVGGVRLRSAACSLLALALTACTPDPAPTPAGPPPVAAAEIASSSAFLDAYAERACDHIATCCQRYDREPLDRKSCLAVSLISALPGGGRDAITAFDPEAASACLTAVSAQRCYDATDARTSACEYVLRPRPPASVPAGGACTLLDDCAPVEGARVDCIRDPKPLESGTVCRTTMLGETGATCDSVSSGGLVVRSCAPDLRCDAGRCVARLDFRCGKQAKKEAELVCGDGYACVADKCALAVSVGAPCDDAEGPACDARYGACREGKCQPLELNGCAP